MTHMIQQYTDHSTKWLDRPQQKTKRVQAAARFPIRATSKVKAILNFALLKWSEKSDHTLKQAPQKDAYTYAAAADLF